jgi:protein-disulfide isomerase
MKPRVFLACAVALVAIAGCNSKPGDAATSKTIHLGRVAAPKGGNWTQMVTPTPQGGFLMGNPNAKIHLIEYGSLTCPHCRAFDEEGSPTLINTYVKSGQVSYEFRNYVRDAFDLTAALVARCNGAKGFFPLAHALYKDQPNWIAKIQATPADQLKGLEDLPPNQQFLKSAQIAGLQQWAAMRGVATAKSTQCLTNENSVNQLVQMTSDATTQYPDFKGTPTFIINGKLADGATWQDLQPQLRTALGERG